MEKPVVKQGKFTKDFGNGFYCTEIKEQAARWAMKFDTPIVSSYDYSENEENKLNILRFNTMSEEWLNFIVNCRNGKIHNYDIVIGAMADDQIYNYINDYVRGIIPREAFWLLVKFKYPTHQIVFCTEKALKCISFLNSEEVEEREFSRTKRRK